MTSLRPECGPVEGGPELTLASDLRLRDERGAPKRDADVQILRAGEKIRLAPEFLQAHFGSDKASPAQVRELLVNPEKFTGFRQNSFYAPNARRDVTDWLYPVEIKRGDKVIKAKMALRTNIKFNDLKPDCAKEERDRSVPAVREANREAVKETVKETARTEAVVSLPEPCTKCSTAQRIGGFNKWGAELTKELDEDSPWDDYSDYARAFTEKYEKQLGLLKSERADCERERTRLRKEHGTCMRERSDCGSLKYPAVCSLADRRARNLKSAYVGGMVDRHGTKRAAKILELVTAFGETVNRADVGVQIADIAGVLKVIENRQATRYWGNSKASILEENGIDPEEDPRLRVILANRQFSAWNDNNNMLPRMLEFNPSTSDFDSRRRMSLAFVTARKIERNQISYLGGLNSPSVVHYHSTWVSKPDEWTGAVRLPQAMVQISSLDSSGRIRQSSYNLSDPGLFRRGDPHYHVFYAQAGRR
jgi:hypothetical protein